MGFLGKRDPENPPPGPIPLQQQPKRIQVVIPNFEVKIICFLDTNVWNISSLSQCGEMSGPAVLPCSCCDSNVWSTVTSSTSTLGWVWFFMCGCCCLGCGILPFFADTFKVSNSKSYSDATASRESRIYNKYGIWEVGLSRLTDEHCQHSWPLGFITTELDLDHWC